jgi:glycosyltransferase involved in cell wall biosynthesis
MLNQPFTFNGNEYIGVQHLFENAADNFTYECIVHPQNFNQKKGTANNYLISPSNRTKINTGCAGISIKDSQIRIIEQGNNGLNTVLAVQFDTSNWIRLVLVYSDKIPTLYINGKMIAKGYKSKFTHIYPSGVFGGNENGECFEGHIKSIKIWKESFSADSVRKLNEGSFIKENNLIWSYDYLNRSMYKNGKRVNTKISVILPTYNKFQEIILTLHSLECQIFKKDEFEVIVVDDGSNDKTPTIVKDYFFSFPLKYIRANQNIGRPKVRNLGIKNASGTIITFLDSEILVNPDFLYNHYAAHMKKEKIVVSGSMVLRGIFTSFQPGFNRDQITRLNGLIRRYPKNSLNIWNRHQKNTPFQLLSKNEIYSQCFQKLSFEKPHVQAYKISLFNNFGNELTGYHFPWLLFCTGNVSVKAKAFIEAGLFEEYPGYGWDDIEMGYRLYKRGYSFLNHTGLIAYHQEHPVAKSNPNDAVKNFTRVFNKYPEMQFRVFAIHYLGISLLNVHLIYNSFLQFSKRFPSQYKLVKDAFYYMLVKISSKLWNDQTLTNLLEGFPGDKKQVKMQLEQLRKIPEVEPFAANFKNMILL